jgi:hypothetical protein
MASYVTRRTSSPHHAEVPTLRPSQQRALSTEPVQGSASSRFSSILRPTSAMRGSFSSRRSRTSVQEATTYEEPSNANMDLSRDIHDHVERDLDNMVNVRACCDGKLSSLSRYQNRIDLLQANTMSATSTCTRCRDGTAATMSSHGHPSLDP